MDGGQSPPKKIKAGAGAGASVSASMDEDVAEADSETELLNADTSIQELIGRAAANRNLSDFVFTVKRAGTRAPTIITLGRQLQIRRTLEQMLIRNFTTTPPAKTAIYYSDATLDLLAFMNTHLSVSDMAGNPFNRYADGYPENLQFAKFYCVDKSAAKAVYAVELRRYVDGFGALALAKFRVACLHGDLPEELRDLAADTYSDTPRSSIAPSTFRALAEYASRGVYIVNDFQRLPGRGVADGTKVAKWFSSALAHSRLFNRCPIQLRAPFVDRAA